MKLRQYRTKVAYWLMCSLVGNIVCPLALNSYERPELPVQTVSSDYVNVSPSQLEGFDLKTVLHIILVQAQARNMLHELPDGIANCYQSLQTSMYVHRVDLEAAMPFIVRALIPAEMIDETGNVVMDKAIRPTGEQGAPIVGAAMCDLTPVLKAISCLRALIIREFNETWTILANLEQELLECCSQIHAEFNATWTMIQACCDQTQDDFNATWTILADIERELLQCCSQNRVDFENTWTMVQACCDQTHQNFNATWTMIQSCCDEISRDFDTTWTILTEIQNDLRDCCTQSGENFNATWTMLQACCDQTQEDFNVTWTMIQNCCDELSQDLAGTWTVLAQLQNDLRDCCTQSGENFNNTWTMIQACCDQTQKDFESTWTILAHIDVEASVDFGGSYTLFNQVDTELAHTWTMIQNCCNEISKDFDGTWTVLAEIQHDLRDCCTQIHEDFNATWTILATIDGDFRNTWTMIQACCAQTQQDFNATRAMLADLNFNVSATVDFGGVYTSLNNLDQELRETWTMIQHNTNTVVRDFNQTWTILNKIDNDVLSCCAQSATNFARTWTMIQGETNVVRTDFNQTWTMITNCCNNIDREFRQTWTMLNHVTAQVDLSGVYTSLNKIDKEFQQTWTMIQSNSNLVGKLFEQTFTIFNNLNSEFVHTWTTLDKIDSDVLACCAQNGADFRQTWTVIQNGISLIQDFTQEQLIGTVTKLEADVFFITGTRQMIATDASTITSKSDIDNLDITVIELLKTILHKLTTMA